MGLKWSADTVGGWQNHFKRLGRWRKRVLTAIEDTERYDFHDVNDFVLAYFIWCHSLREWLINSETIERRSLDRQLGHFAQWAVCRDIANRSRHFHLTRNPRDKDWSISREYDLWAKLENRPERHKLHIVSDDRIYSVEDLIEETYQMWETILSGVE